MTVGEALAEARTRAGLSVDEVSERTKIREVVIRGLERDDYEACGGDLYVRGYVRVIADAVGLDAQPLIREYDRIRQGGATIAPGRPAPEPAAPGAPAPGAPAPGAPAPDPAEPFERLGRLERLDRLDRLDRLEVSRADPGVIDLTRAAAPGAADLSRAGSPETLIDMMRAAAPGDSSRPRAGLRETAADLPALGHGAPRWRIQPGARPRTSSAQGARGNWLRGHRLGVAAVAVAIAVFAVAVAGGQVFSGGGGSGGGGSGAGATGSTAARQTPPGLPVSFAEAFGPSGPGDGDNPVSATYPVTPGATEPWTTQQYPTAQFGDQKTGTGLLLDMGRAVTVTGVAVSLGAGPGAGLQLQAGNTIAGLATAASAANARGNVTLHPAKPVHARYLLVWFTQLPRASDGQYQASVYHITVDGRP